MTKSSEYYNLETARYKAITYNWDTISSNGNNSKLYCLTDFQASWLQSNTAYMAWSARWLNCPCTDDDLEAMKAELEYNLMNCLDVQPWQMAYLYDQAQQANLDHLDFLWDGVNADSVNPETPNDFYSGDDSNDRLNALCTACKIYVYSYAENFLAKASIALGLSVTVGLVASITIVGGIIASVLVGGLVYVTKIAMDAMQDTTALDNVVCCMFNDLDGKAITQANFITALDSCAFTVGSNEAIIRDILASDLDKFPNWLTFINQLGNSYTLAEIGITDCPCILPWEKTWDFTVESGTPDGWQQVTWGDGWFSGFGWRSQTDGTRQSNYLQQFMPNTGDVTFLEMTIANSGTPVNFSSGGNVGYIVAWKWDSGGGSELLRYDADGTPINTTIPIYNNASAIETDRWGLLSNPYTGSDWFVTSATIKGIGVNPFI